MLAIPADGMAWHGLCVVRNRVPCKNGRTSRDVIWHVDLWAGSPTERGTLGTCTRHLFGNCMPPVFAPCDYTTSSSRLVDHTSVMSADATIDNNNNKHICIAL